MIFIKSIINFIFRLVLYINYIINFIFRIILFINDNIKVYLQFKITTRKIINKFCKKSFIQLRF